MRKKTFVGLFLIISYVFFAGIATAEEIQSQNFKKLSSLYTYNDTSPYISGDFVVWGSKSTPIATARHIMFYDLLKNKEIQITTNNFDNNYPAVDGDLKLVVYLSVRNGLHGVYLCEYNPQNETCPEVKILEDANYKFYTEIDGNRIVWVEYASTAPYRRIYACDYDFAGHCPKELIVGGQNISRPNLEGNLLLWEDRTSYDGGTETEHLFLHDFTTGNTYDLAKGDNVMGDMAAIDGNTIVWAKQKYNMSLQRWGRVMVHCQYTPQNAPNVCAMTEVDTTMGKSTLYAPMSPSVSGKRVVYRNDLEKDPSESVTINADIYHYNTETGEILRVTNETASQHMPMVSGNRLVWREVQPNNIVLIRLYEFKAPNQAPVLASIGNKTVDDSTMLQFQVSGTDADNDQMSFTHPLLQDIPLGAAFNTTLDESGRLEGAFSWTPGVDQIGDYYVSFEVFDGQLYASELVSIHVAKRLYCADGIISSQLGEVCDSNTQACTSGGYAGTSSCNSQCSGFDACVSAERCGDGIVNGSEQCDGTAGVGANQVCSGTCGLIKLPYCGDGIKNGMEECEGSAGIGEHQICSDTCVLIILPYCGDGVVNGSEQCDGTAGVGLHQECSTNCQILNLPYCGDGIVNGSEQCDGMAGVGQGQKCTTSCTLVRGDDADSRKKVIICHIPPGNPGKAHTIQISRSALKAHLAHGDTLGACRLPPASQTKKTDNVQGGKDNRSLKDTKPKQTQKAAVSTSSKGKKK